MITGITHTVRYVPDYDQALEFYRDLLGMRVVTDTSMAPDKMRWLGVGATQQSGVELVLQVPSDWMSGEALARAEAQFGQQSMICLSTDDIQGVLAQPFGSPALVKCLGDATCRSQTRSATRFTSSNPLSHPPLNLEKGFSVPKITVSTVVQPLERIEYVLGDGRRVTVSFEAISRGETRVTEVFDPEDVNPEELQRGGWGARVRAQRLERRGGRALDSRCRAGRSDFWAAAQPSACCGFLLYCTRRTRRLFRNRRTGSARF